MHERIDPYSDLNIMRLSRLAHLKRYQKVCEFLSLSDHVLDAGCGFGYGADMLSQFSKNVVGIDKNPTAISVAKNKYRSKVKYFVYDIEEISPHNFQFFDYVTMFEVIEHLTNPKKALEFLKSYHWSSHLDYLGIKNFPSILNMKHLTEIFGSTKDYQKLVENYLKDIQIDQEVILE